MSAVKPFQMSSIDTDSRPKKKDSNPKKSGFERQKAWRQRLFNSHRFQAWDIGTNIHDGSDGYQSDDSTYSSTSSLSSEQLSQIDHYPRQFIFQCSPDINSEWIINRCLTAIETQIDNIVDDFDAITQAVDGFFNLTFLNKMSSFIAVKSIGLKVQTNIMKMLDKMVGYCDLTDASISNLIESSIVQKLVEAIDYGSDDLVEWSLKLLMSCLSASPSRPELLSHILRCGFGKAVYNRTSQLRWRSPKSKAKDIRGRGRPTTVSATSLSLTSQKLFNNFSQALIQIANFDIYDNHRKDLLEYLVPLFNQLLSCPDKQVLNNTINCFLVLISKNERNKDLMLSLVRQFGATLMAMISTKDESVVLTIMQLINKIIESYPEMVFIEDFGSQLMSALNALNDRNSQKLNKEAIVLLSSVGQWVDIRDDKSRQLSDRLLYLSLIMLKRSVGCDQYNIESALHSVETLLAKYPFQAFVQFIVCSKESRDILRHMLKNNDQRMAQVVNKVVGLMQTLIDTNETLWPEGAHIARQTLFDGLNRTDIGPNTVPMVANH